MDMLDRYLQAVRFFLPPRQQDDIVRELSENLISQMEDREEELGRPLDEAEQAAILKRHGHPMVVAGRYRSWQQLIGPVFFPLYLFSLKAGLAIALLVTVVLASVTAVLQGDPLRHALEAIQAYPGRALMVFAWTTLGFAGLDLAQGWVRLTHDWDPRTLPKVVRHEHRIPRLRTLCELFFILAGLIWLLLIPNAPFLILGPAAAFVTFAPIWRLVYMPMVLLTVATAALHVADFARPYWTTRRAVMRVLISVAWLFLFALLANAGDLFLPAYATTLFPEGVRADRVIDVVNASFQVSAAVAAAITVFDIVQALRRLKRRRANPVPSGSAPAGAGR